MGQPEKITKAFIWKISVLFILLCSGAFLRQSNSQQYMFLPQEQNQALKTDNLQKPALITDYQYLTSWPVSGQQQVQFIK